MRTIIKILSVVILTAVSVFATAQEVRELSPVSLWQGTKVHARSVKLTPYLPADDGRRHPAVIVCPGGSYFWLARKTEGHNVARWLCQNGFAAFVLEYRTAGVPAYAWHTRMIVRGRRHPDMIQDAQRAIEYVRENAAKLSVDTSRVGIMGFSAGGHLAVMAAVFYKTNFLLPLGITPSVSLRPDFAVPVYPVVSMSAPCTHKRSRRALLGEWRKYNKTLRDSLSMEKQIRPGVCQMLIVNCKDDPTVDYRNSVLLDSALTWNAVPHRYVQYSRGGHGFGVSPEKTTKEAITWKDEFLMWFRENFER